MSRSTAARAFRPPGSTPAFALALLVVALSPHLRADTTKCGAVCDETWNQAGSPYVVTCDVTVAETCSLSIESGVEVRVVAGSPKVRVEVEGTIDVQGTATERVIFRSDEAAPADSDWDGLYLMQGASADLDHVDISHALYGVFASGASVVDLSSVDLESNYDGLRVQGSGPPSVTATGCSFTGNTRSGVYLYGSPNPDVTITGSAIHSNGSAYDLITYGYADSWETIVPVRENWWGTTDTEEISARILDHRYWVDRPFVDYCGFLDGPGGVPARDAHCPDLVTCGETQTWNLVDKPYMVVTDLFVCPGASLRIEPGVEVRVAKTSARLDFLVQGTLDVAGSPTSPVLMTSDASPPSTGDWIGPQLSDNSTSTIEHAEIHYADRGIWADGDAVVSLQNLTSTNNDDGLYVQGNGPPSVTATECSFTGNTRSGVYLYGSPDPDVSITASSIHSNGSAYDLITYGYADPWNTIVPVRGNWWGTTDTEQISGRIVDHRYAHSRPFVDYCGFLDGPEGVRARDAHCPDLVTCGETQIWDLLDRPYMVVTDFYVCPGSTLRIEPGVEVRVAKTSARLDFLVQGTLEVAGTPSSPVSMTSDEIPPSTGDWIGPQLSTSSTSTIEHAEIRYADRGIWVDGDAVVSLYDVTATLGYDGLYVQGNGPPSVTATECSFTGNSRSGVYLSGRPDPDVSITASSIHSNGGAYDFITYGYADPWNTIVPVRGNWWGTTDTEQISGRIVDHRYAHSRPFVDYCGFLDGPGGVSARDAHCPDLVTCGETQTWDLVDRPYMVVTDLYVCPGATLRIDPGVEMRVAKTSAKLDVLVEGTLDVAGTRTEPVVLTSDAPAPEAGDWIGVFLGGSSTSTIEHAEITHARHGVRLAGDSVATLLDVKATGNTDGLLVQSHGVPTLRAAGCTLTNNERAGLYVHGMPDPDVSITRSSLHSNLGHYDLQTDEFADPDGSVVWALDNWWGTSDLDLIADRVHDRADSPLRPRVAYRGYGSTCEIALGRDVDGDGWPDFDDNCPEQSNGSQADDDEDGMGDACDPAPLVAPSEPCDGLDDASDGYLDVDGDGWGDPCDHQPTLFEANPGAAEICDARDDDGDAEFGSDELVDDDVDFGLRCGDCEDDNPDVNSCGCELCLNGHDDDCDGYADGGDADCVPYPTCVVLAGGGDPDLTITEGACGGANLGGPYDVVRGYVDALAFSGSSVDLGELECVEGGLDWDRVTEYSARPNPRCDESPAVYFLGRHSGTPSFGSASSGEPRDVMEPSPPCP